MTRTDQVTFVVFTYNEASRIERVLLNLRDSGPVLVVDNHSADDTREIAQRLGARVLLNKNPGWVEDEVTAQVVKAAVSTPWIYWGYADEMLSAEMLNHLISLVESDKYDVVSISKKNYFYGRFCYDAFAGGALPRLFRKEAVDFTGNKIHHFGRLTVLPGRVCHLDSSRFFVHQFIANSTKTMMSSVERYSDIELAQGSSAGPARMIARLFRTFFSNYFVRGGHKAGLEGFYFCFYNMIYDILLEMKRFERERSYSRPKIEQLNDVWRDAMLKQQEVLQVGKSSAEDQS
ncbi:glycosyltransferase [Sphingomonas sp. MMS12-HWE2-04]|uniref:glycosyltransferase n=1 Tax=Sphingomonas sp. MMS12-HWE2-04 TaxID=3234199 RepID=UPI00384B4616